MTPTDEMEEIWREVTMTNVRQHTKENAVTYAVYENRI
jgi:hypothetical protein